MLTQPNILSLLQKYFGYSSFRAQQEDIIQHILEQKDGLIIMPTGGGKSICFQIPALAFTGMTVVVSPLIALMKDQVDGLKANGISAGFFNSSQAAETQNSILKGITEQKLKLLYVAPESLDTLKPYLKDKVALFAIDEAHCISSWGHDFRPAYIRLGALKEEFPDTPIAAFTATADQATQQDILEQLKIKHAKKFISSFDRKNLYLEVRPGIKRIQQIFSFLRDKKDQSGIIYCLSRKSTEMLTEKLKQKGYKVMAYHAGLEAQKRSEVQEAFLGDSIDIVVATIAFGMGIDKSNVRWVIHYNLPKNIESYYQEIGRSGRDGLPANTLLFYSYADVVQLRKFIDNSSNQDVQIAKLNRMQQFAEALSCRRIALLNYFGEHISEGCGNCDNCNTPPQFFDGTILTQKVCSAIYRLKENENLSVLMDVLRGSAKAEIYDKGYNKIKTYGAARDVPWLDLQQFIIQMVNQGIINIYFHENNRLVLTPLAHEILFKAKKVKLAKLDTKPKEEPKQIFEDSEVTGLFEKLRALRTEIAKQENVPPYIIFSDAALKDMEVKLPKDSKEFLDVNGVGDTKNKKYGRQFLAVIKTFLAEKTKKPSTKKATELKTLDLLKDGLSIDEIAEHRALSSTTIYGHLIKLHQSGQNINLYTFVTKDEVATIAKATESLAIENKAMKPIFEHFDEKIPYWKIRMALYLKETE